MNAETLALTGAPEISIVIPTFNEVDNVAPLLDKIEAAMTGFAWEAIFVDDDSRDGTQAEIARLALRDVRVRMIRRIGRRGLSSAVVEGMLASSARFFAVIDADMQHDETILPRMVEALRSGATDLAVGSRYVEGGGVGAWDEGRQRISRFATALSTSVTKTPLTDPMSGFFVITREAMDQVVRNLSAQGYKILVDVLASAPRPLRVREFPYEFRTRTHGESKLDTVIVLEYVLLLLDKTIGHIVPARFILFMGVGGMGLVVHMAVLSSLHYLTTTSFAVQQGVATMLAMTFNFFLNNVLTYRDRRLKGFGPLLIGLFSFYAVCGAGAVSNVGIAAVLFENHYAWWLSGVAGVVVGAVWNFAASSIFTWRNK